MIIDKNENINDVEKESKKMKNEMWEQKIEPMVIDKNENANMGEKEFKEKKTDKLKQKKRTYSS